LLVIAVNRLHLILLLLRKFEIIDQVAQTRAHGSSSPAKRAARTSGLNHFTHRQSVVQQSHHVNGDMFGKFGRCLSIFVHQFRALGGIAPPGGGRLIGGGLGSGRRKNGWTCAPSRRFRSSSGGGGIAAVDDNDCPGSSNEEKSAGKNGCVFVHGQE